MRFIELESIDDERVSAYVNLTEIQLRNRLEPAKGLFIAESPKVIDRALAAHREPLSLLVERPWLEGMANMLARIDEQWGPDIPVYVASPEQLKRLTFIETDRIVFERHGHCREAKRMEFLQPLERPIMLIIAIDAGPWHLEHGSHRDTRCASVQRVAA